MTPSRTQRALFLVGRDPLHPRAAGGDLQAWQWARRLADEGWHVQLIAQHQAGLRRHEGYQGVEILRPGAGPLLAVKAARHYRRNRRSIDLVYEDPIGSGRTPYLAPLYSRAPVIAVWHQVSGSLVRSMRGSFSALIVSAIEKVIARAYRGARLWAPSRDSADEVSSVLRIPRDRIMVIPPTLDTEISIADSPRLGGHTVLAMGVMRSYKNFEHVIEAMPLVLRTLPNARLVIAGRHGADEYETLLATMIQQLRLKDSVSLLFDLSDEDRQSLMRDSTVLVLPSLLEGFGIVSIEANAEGTPVIASSGVPRAAVENDVNGLRFDHGNIEQLAACIIRVLSDQDLQRRLAHNSLAHAKGLTADAVWPKFRELVDTALGEPRLTEQL